MKKSLLLLVAAFAVSLFITSCKTEVEIKNSENGGTSTGTTASAKIYKITFDANGGEGVMAAQICTSGVEYNIASNLMKKEGYYFSNWSTKKNGEGVVYDDCGLIKLSDNITLYAQYSVSDGTLYTVNHYIETQTDDQWKLYGRETLSGKTTGTTAAYERILEGFTAREVTQGTIKADGSTVVNVYYDRNTYKVTFYINKGTEDKTVTQDFKFEEEKALLANSFKVSKNAFKGWTTKSNGSGDFYGNKEVIKMGAGNLFLYANWTVDTKALDVLNVDYVRNGNDVELSWGIPDDNLVKITLLYKANVDDDYTTVELDSVTSSYVIKGETSHICYDYEIFTTDEVDNVSTGVSGVVATQKDLVVEGVTIPYTAMISVMKTPEYKVTVVPPDTTTKIATSTSTSTTLTNTSDFTGATEADPKIVKNFMLGQYEVTQKLWYAIECWGWEHGYTTGSISAVSSEENYPIRSKYLKEIKPWCNKLSEYCGLEPCYYTDEEFTQVLKNSSTTNIYINTTANGYRLPTDEEWEFAARGGDQNNADWNHPTAGHLPESKYNFKQTYDYSTSPSTCIYSTEVGSYLPNRLNFYDMSGNVGEYTEAGKVRGKWCSIKINTSYSYSFNGYINSEENYTHYSNSFTGFRLCRSITID